MAVSGVERRQVLHARQTFFLEKSTHRTWTSATNSNGYGNFENPKDPGIDGFTVNTTMGDSGVAGDWLYFKHHSILRHNTIGVG